jgi:hypothetical protein
MFHEPNTDQTTNPLEDGAELIAVTQNPAEGAQMAGPLRFSIGQLLVAMAVAAVLLALFRAMGIVGAALAFAVAFAFTLGIYPRWQPSQPRQAAMFDFVCGMLMPLVCLVFDPFVFKDEKLPPNASSQMAVLGAQIYNGSFVAYAVLGWQIATMGIVLAAGRVRGPWAGIVTGTLFLGAGFAAVIGVLLVPLATIGLLMVIGVLGYTPLFTAYAFIRRYKQVSQQAIADLPKMQRIAWGVLGVIAAMAIPTAVGLALLVATRGAEALTQLLSK